MVPLAGIEDAEADQRAALLELRRAGGGAPVSVPFVTDPTLVAAAPPPPRTALGGGGGGAITPAVWAKEHPQR